jgi:hypothetical protein
MSIGKSEIRDTEYVAAGEYVPPHAVQSQTWRNGVYLIKDNKVIGKMELTGSVSGRAFSYRYVVVQPDDDATREFFKDDYSIKPFGMIRGLKYDGEWGEPYLALSDEPEGRHMGTRIVDVESFDLGVCPKSFETVEGFGACRT